MSLTWSRLALADRDEIFDYVEADSPRAAVALDEVIAHHVEQLAAFPLLGRAGRVEGTRERVIPGTPYVVAYRIIGEAIEVIRILHGSRQWSDDLP